MERKAVDPTGHDGGGSHYVRGATTLLHPLPNAGEARAKISCESCRHNGTSGIDETLEGMERQQGQFYDEHQ